MNNSKTQNIKNYTNSSSTLLERKNILFSRLPEKNVNKERYDNILSFWDSAILDVARKFNVLIFTPKLLQEVFTINNTSPNFLPVVLNELHKSSNITTLDNFFKEIGWTKWIFDKLVMSPLKSYTGILQNNVGSVPNQKLVIAEILKEKAEEVYQIQSEKIHTTTDCIVPMGKLEKLIQDWLLSKEELDLLVQVLVKQGFAVLILSNTGERKGLKFRFQGESEQLKSEESDIGILHLLTTLDSLKIQEEKLREDIEVLNVEIKKSIRQKQKSHALVQLRKKKQFDDILEKRIESSTNIHNILLSIESAQSNQQIVEAMRSGATALKKVNEKLPIEEVDKVFEDLQDTLTDQKEIDDALKQGNASTSMNNFTLEEEQELEEELKLLEEQVQKQQQPTETTATTPIKNEIQTTTTTTTTTSEPEFKIPVEILSKEEEDNLLLELEKLQLNSKEKDEEPEKEKKKLILESN
ncbi:SNF7 family protein [Tieghemostelium lacteum]|uniref:SNF7 family protein n=1 Tax=Tieghemostelium lacteum TaxID=361077 RepID=A0A151ZD59_TIELA|nr:SNF7 family protein [Tieghemostelium lacteum]|eukprot:KYQ91886.1 SNF7 family protein [Tieghemostelium lacteum]